MSSHHPKTPESADLTATLHRLQVLFYCHYPDMLLATRTSHLHRLYRAPLDWLEEQSTGAADQVLVNSEFTRGASWRGLRACVR